MAKERLDREAWLQRALEVLRLEGIQGVRVERLAKDLGVTKGSFYWHFQDRADLQRAILDYWAETYSNVITNAEEYQTGDPASALLTAMANVRKQGLDRYELAIRAWADHDDVAAASVQAVYAQRRGFLRKLFERMGFSGAEAEVRSRLMLCYMCWEPSLVAGETTRQRVRWLRLHHQLLTQR